MSDQRQSNKPEAARVTHRWAGPYHDRLEYLAPDGHVLTMEEIKGLLNHAYANLPSAPLPECGTPDELALTIAAIDAAWKDAYPEASDPSATPTAARNRATLLAKGLKCAQENFSVTNAAYIKADKELAAVRSATRTLSDDLSFMNAVLDESDRREFVSAAAEHVKNHPDDQSLNGRQARLLLALDRTARSTTGTLPLDPTPAMIEAGAQRLVRWGEEECKWPDSWSSMDVRAARNDAERCWRSMWLEATGLCLNLRQAMSRQSQEV